jgi:hypothetical protein
MLINNSRCRTASCFRRYYWEYEFLGTGIKPEILATPLLDGLAIHAGLAEMYAGSAGYNAAMEIEYRKKVGDKENYSASQLDEIDISIDWGGRLLDLYHTEVYLKETRSVLQIETEFCVTLGEVCWRCGDAYNEENLRSSMKNMCYSCRAEIHHLVGKADLVTLDPKGRVEVDDHKTTGSNISSSYLASWSHSFQLIGYAYGVARATGLDVKRYSINILKKKTVGTEGFSTKRCEKCKGKGFRILGTKQHCQECDGEGRVPRDKIPTVFHRETYPVQSYDTARMVHNRIQICNALEAQAELFGLAGRQDEAYPMNDRMCHQYNKECPYASLCWGSKVRPDLWWKPTDLQLVGFEQNPPSYVDEMMREDTRQEGVFK